jgi:V8-like Glu-specific endopeptidase
MAGWHEFCEEQSQTRKTLARSVAAIFEGSPTGSGIVLGTGFLKGPTTVVTAKHLFNDEQDTSTLCCVFGFGSEPELKIYGINAISRRGPDSAYLTLDRPVEGRSLLDVNASGQIRDTDQMFVVGYPQGLLCKISDDCQLMEIEEQSFAINLQPENGASGAPVFNARTLKIEGILLEGEQLSACEKSSYFC